MRYLLRLDLERIRRNLEAAHRVAVTDDDLHRALASRGVWRHSGDWWGATEAAVAIFAEGEIIEIDPPTPRSLGGVPAPGQPRDER